MYITIGKEARPGVFLHFVRGENKTHTVVLQYCKAPIALYLTVKGRTLSCSGSVARPASHNKFTVCDEEGFSELDPSGEARYELRRFAPSLLPVYGGDAVSPAYCSASTAASTRTSVCCG